MYMTNFNLKYFKYKKKYLELKIFIEQKGGNKIMTFEELKKSSQENTPVTNNTLNTIKKYIKDENVYKMFKNIIIEMYQDKKDQDYYLDSLKYLGLHKQYYLYINLLQKNPEDTT